VTDKAVSCGLAAHAFRRAEVEQLAELRRQPGPAPTPIPASLLRHSDEQTVVALAAVLLAIERSSLPWDFAEWGTVAAPRFVGRTSVAHSLPGFLAEGAWGVSPHLIPHHSVHSVSGTISQALALHGPNFGACGGPNADEEALLAAVTLLHEARLPGVWVVLSRLCPEGPCDRATGRAAPGTTVEARALALTPLTDATATRLELTVGDDGPRVRLFTRGPR
jgi:hypothetical protein